MSSELIRIRMKQGRTIDREGGGTETYASGCEYDVTEEVAKNLRNESVVIGQNTQAPVVNLQPPPAALEFADDTKEEEEE